MLKGLPRAIILLWITLAIALIFAPDSALPAKWAQDSNIIASMASGEMGDLDGYTGGSYQSTAKFFELLGTATKPFLAGLAAASLWFFMRGIVTLPALGMALFITLPAIVFGMIRPQKEVLVVAIALVIYLCAQRYGRRMFGLLMSALYLLYAMISRKYFGIIVGMYWMVRVTPRIKPRIYVVFMVLLGMLAVYFLPLHVLETLQASRDQVNFLRLALNPDNARTAFVNLLPIKGGTEFIVNYVYAVIRLNVPILFMVSFSALSLMVTQVMYGVVLIFGYRADKDDPSAVVLTALFIAHLLVLPLFEPDWGSYLRHTSSVFLYLTPGLLAFDRWVATRYPHWACR